jgi:hypothetical protein
MRTLLALGNGSMIVGARGRRTVGAFLGRGWISPTPGGFRITPTGLRALADAVEEHGLPEMSA